MSSHGGQNDRMSAGGLGTAGIVGLAAAIGGAVWLAPGRAAEFDPKNPLNPPAPPYWCPNRTPDRQYSANPEPGCAPLVGKEEKSFKEKSRAPGKPAPEKEPVRIQDIQAETGKFLDRYRRFLDCCADNPGFLAELEDLEDEAVHLLRSMEAVGFLNMGTSQRGFTVSQIVRPVATARDTLRKLRADWRTLEESQDRLGRLDYEKEGRERRRIQQEEHRLKEEFRPAAPPRSAPTGTDLSSPDRTQGPPASTLPSRVGTTIESTTLPNAFGADIGEVGSPASDQKAGLNARKGLDTQDTTLPTRQGTATQSTTLRPSVGFEAGTEEGPTGRSTLPSRAGPAIGDSSLNSR
jgi:hypothetical protein